MKKIIAILMGLIIISGFVLAEQRLREISLAQRPVEMLVIKNCKLIDGTGKRPRNGKTVVIQGGRFSIISPDSQANLPENAQVIEAGSRAVVPGLIDAHFHMGYPDSREHPFELNEALCAFRAEYFLFKHLMGGITTVMNAGAYKNVGFMAKKAFVEGLLIGSRPIIVEDRISATGGHKVSRFPMAYEADGPDEWRKAVRTQIKKSEKAGVKMAVGTDAIYEVKQRDPGLSFDEVERFVKNGDSPLEAISAATKIGAEVLGVAGKLGQLNKTK
ncbi:MAG: amidohydrolase family protein [Candidatus Aminicenantes bacterium]|nr:amidohydrolase family protein [Candidatus Aminicenantes bacterium]